MGLVKDKCAFHWLLLLRDIAGESFHPETLKAKDVRKIQRSPWRA